MQTIKVLHLIKSLDVGGIENMVLDFANNAHKHGIDAHVYCMGGGALENEFLKSPAKFSLQPKLPFTNELIDPFLLKQLRNYIIKNEIDIVHCHFVDEGLHAALACALLKKVVVVQNFAVDFRINRKIDNLKFKLVGKMADAHIAVSQVTLEQMKAFKIPCSKLETFIHNGVDPQRVVLGNTSNLKKELGLQQNTILGGMTGNFYNSVRNQYTVCQALAKAMKTNHGFHFVFAGGSQNKWVKSKKSYFLECVEFCKNEGITDRVHFPGLREDVNNILAGIDFYVHSTNYDTFGIAPVEAMFNKLPVIANNHSVFIETSHNGKGMWLYEDKNTDDLANKILQLINDENLRKKLGTQHYNHALENFHIDVHIKNLKGFYLKCLETKRGKL